ncbi:pyridine nucleotide-disulfide oxidoreductase [Saccharothrix sp. ALI-22-I]|uniref:FAD/NAD(P)-binding protein n=1 Tax=Saccharothrix sp. ALI-22-I TaxID=1933778 RepID=UPI00097C8F19|nr:FAD/NAD(P)-binding protein [Saccharothrix sp. ALI-22-I]ONI84833.1 pyridine nucleotide-disulfide oxidoreductase [Saccharothrix sp. ALI-22-I]
MGFVDRPRRVVIVGAGLGGTATAIRLLRFARDPLQVVLVERRPEYRNSGVAYQRDSNHWHHIFNIQAGRMSAFREDVDDFVNWANHEADRTGWPPEWCDFTFHESGPAPRRIYPDYLANRLAEAAREACDGVRLIEADGEVVDLEVGTDVVRVIVSGPGLPTGEVDTDGSVVEANASVVEADHVVLATGLEQRYPAFAAEVADHPAFVRNAYSQAGIERVLGVRPDGVVAIIGTLLTAYDAATVLLRRGHTGRIHMISRSGLTPRTYPADHRHRVIDLPRPRLLDDDTYDGQKAFVRRFTEEWGRARAVIARDHPEVSPDVVTERIAKAWEPYLPEVLAKIPSAELRGLLNRYGSLLAVLRVSAMAYTTEVVDAAMGEGGQVVITTGGVEEIRATETGRLVLSIASEQATQTIEADLVISNFGRESDYRRVDSPLWSNLLRKKIAVAHERTGRGVEVDVRGNLLGPGGIPSGPISVIGSPREGDEIVRIGRTGAFTFNLAAIKNHSVVVAATALHRLERRYDEQAADVVAMSADPPDGELADAVAHSVALDVRRMATRRRDDREALGTRVEESIRAIREITTRDDMTPVSDRALRYAVNAAATTKLTDLSVTPRELRSVLGLDEPAE